MRKLKNEFFMLAILLLTPFLLGLYSCKSICCHDNHNNCTVIVDSAKIEKFAKEIEKCLTNSTMDTCLCCALFDDELNKKEIEALKQKLNYCKKCGE
ncbi:hypothetical protein ACFLSQ_03775 [Bacteroidota bacterium]